MKIELNWQQRAVIVLAGSLILLSALLAIFAIRDAQRERLLAESATEEEQRRCADAVADQVETALADVEGRVGRLLQRYGEDLDSERFAEVSKGLLESELLLRVTFLVDGQGQATFAGVKPLYILAGEESRSIEAPAEVSNAGLWARAEEAEFQARDYLKSIGSYQQLMAQAPDRGAKAFFLSRIGRCHAKARSFRKAIEAYRKVLEVCPPDATTEGIPLGVIAWSQIGDSYLNDGKKEEAAEAFLALYENLLDPKWSLTKSQFAFHTKRTEERVNALINELSAADGKDDIAARWNQLNRLEDERLELTKILEYFTVRIVPRLHAEHTETGSASTRFFHVAESSDDALSLVSYVGLNDRTFGMILNPEVLAQEILPQDPRKIRMREGWYVQVEDGSGKIVAGQNVSFVKPSAPQLTFTGAFAEGFPPWRINVYQSDTDAPKRQYQLRMGIYVFSAVTVIAALFLGGLMAIRGTAKELKLAALKSDFVSTVSHEFRTPLMSIRYLAELLQRGRVPDEQKKQQYYETITNESERLGRLVENILDFSKIETGIKEYRMEERDIAALAADVAARFRQQAGLKDFNLETRIADDMPGIVIDREAISRALFNLLDNAVKYSEENPRILVRAWQDADHVFLEVADNGIGIRLSEQPKVFEKFYRSEQAVAGNVKGSGIGLTLVDHIVKAHQGKVLLESEPGRGTKVTIQLPTRLPANDEGNKDG